MCELGSTVTADSSQNRKSGSTGFPIKGVIVSAFDIETNEELPYRERGEIRVQSPARMKGYFKNVEATNKYFFYDDKGAVSGCTGDIGFVDEDGFVYILGRASDKFIVKNKTEFFCFDIENVILENDNIASCEVVGVPKEGYYVPDVHVVLEDKCQLSHYEIIKEIHEMCVQRLDVDCVPWGYKIRDVFPVKNNGKRDMELLKQEKEGFVMPQSDMLINIHF